MESLESDHPIQRWPFIKPRLLWALLGVAFLLRAGYAFHLPNELIFPDAQSFDGIAWNLVSTGHYGQGLTPTAVRLPSYVVFLATIYKLTGHHLLIARLLQSALGVGLVLVIIAIAGELGWSPLTRCIAGGVAAFYPFFIYYDGQLISDAFLTFWHTTALFLFLRWRHRRSSVRDATLMGLAFSILCLTKTVFIPLFSFILFVEACLCARDRSRPFPFKAFLAAGVAFGFFILCWGARNEKIFGRFVLDTHGGRTLVETVVFHEQCKNGTFPQFWANHPLRKMDETMDEGKLDTFYLAYVKDYVRDHRWLYLQQSLVRLKDFWRFYPRQDLTYLENKKVITALSLLTEPFLILTALVGIYKTRHRWRELYPFWAAILLLTAIHTLTTGQMRYRLPLMPIMILFSAYALFNNGTDYERT